MAEDDHVRRGKFLWRQGRREVTLGSEDERRDAWTGAFGKHRIGQHAHAKKI